MTCATQPQPEVFDGEVVAAGLSIRLAGIAVELDGETITGSAGAFGDQGPPMERARFELAERLALLQAMKEKRDVVPAFDAERRSAGLIPRSEVFPANPDEATCRWSRSSGVAAGTSFADAAWRARCELVERDRVLRSWFGEIVPRRIADSGDALPSALFAHYDVAAYALPEQGSDTYVAAAFAFPRAEGPLVYGFGARRSEAEALRVAAGELVQRLGFLWGEALPSCAPVPSPTAHFHQEHYLFRAHHRQLRRWLGGEHAALHGALRTTHVEEPLYVELGPPGGPVVVKAVPRGHVPLAFGLGHPLLRRDVSPDAAVHPVP